MLTRWDPFREMMTMRSQMDRMLGDWMRTSGGWGEGEGAGTQRLDLDVSENDNAYIVCASIPGMKPEDLDINVQNNMLTISGETRNEREEQDERWHLRERRFGRFQRILAIPNNVNPDEIGAEYQDGVLTLTLPKTEEAKPRKISVSGGQQTIEGKAESGGSQ